MMSHAESDRDWDCDAASKLLQSFAKDDHDEGGERDTEGSRKNHYSCQYTSYGKLEVCLLCGRGEGSSVCWKESVK